MPLGNSTLLLPIRLAFFMHRFDGWFLSNYGIVVKHSFLPRFLQASDGGQESLPRYTGSSSPVASSRRVTKSASVLDPSNISEGDEHDLDDWGQDVNRAPSPRDGNTDCEGSSSSLSDEEDASGGDSGDSGGRGGDGGDGGDGNGNNVNAAPRKVGAVRVRDRRGPLRWGVARLLDARLGGYMLPGAVGPDVSFSSSVCCALVSSVLCPAVSSCTLLREAIVIKTHDRPQKNVLSPKLTY